MRSPDVQEVCARYDRTLLKIPARADETFLEVIVVYGGHTDFFTPSGRVYEFTAAYIDADMVDHGF